MPMSSQIAGRSSFLTTEQVDALAPRDLDHADSVLVGRVGDPAQLVGVGDSAAHARHDRERAVVLDVGVDSVVDVPGAALLAVAIVVDLGDQIGERRLAETALAAGAARLRDLAHGIEAALHDLLRNELAALLAARAQVGGLLAAAGHGHDVGHEWLARPAARPGAGDAHHLLLRAHAVLGHRAHDVALADAV